MIEIVFAALSWIGITWLGVLFAVVILTKGEFLESLTTDSQQDGFVLSVLLGFISAGYLIWYSYH